MPDRDVAATFLHWSWMRAVFHRGWWLVASLYLVVVAELSVSQLMVYFTVLGTTGLLGEIPTGVMADTISRKRSLVIAHLLMGAGMTITGLVTAFPVILVTQVFWGLGWTFSSGADVAWVTDELDEPDRISGVLIARARWEQIGAVGGIVGFGALAWATDLGTAVAVAGIGMIVLGLFVVARFPEHNFTPTREHRWRESMSIFRRGVALAWTDRHILVIFGATFLVNGGAQGFDFLFQKRLLALGLAERPEPIVWFTALGLAALAVGALALRIVEARIEGAGAPPRVYAAAAFIGAFGMIVLAHAPDEATAVAGVLLVGGIAWPVTRAVSVIWVNQRATSDVRATVHSFLSQAEYFGEILASIALAVLAQAATITVVLMASSALVALAGVLVIKSRAASIRAVEIVDS